MDDLHDTIVSQYAVPQDFLDALSQGTIPVPPASYVWVIAHTRPRCEKKLQRLRNDEEIGCFLPLRRKILTYGNRRRETFNPLFPGYVFCVIHEEYKHFLKQNRYVANLLDVCNQEELANLLVQVQKALNVGEDLEVLPFIQKGQHVRVLGGPFKDVVGEVIHTKSGTRVVLNIDLIQQSVSFEIDTALLGPV